MPNVRIDQDEGSVELLEPHTFSIFRSFMNKIRESHTF